MSDNLKYCRPSDLLSPVTTTPDVDPIADPEYGLTALSDLLLSKPCKFDGVGPLNLVFDMGVQTRIDAFALPNHNLATGTVCSVQMNATDVWTSPTVNGSMTVGANHANGHRASPWIDLTQVAGYSVSGFRYLRLVVPAQVYNIQIGERLIIGNLREFDEWPQFGGTKGAQRRWLENLETEYGVQRVSRRKITQRTFSVTVKGSDQDFEDLQYLGDDASGVARPFFVAFVGNVFTDGGLLVRFTKETAEKLEATEEWFNVNPFTFSVRELSRSLPLLTT